MKLRFMEGPRVGRLVDLDQDVMTLGRDDTCELKLDEDGISREHARIHRDGDKFKIEDLNSTNGVFVNGKKIDGKQELKLNDKVRIGGILMLMTDATDILDTTEVAKLKNAVEGAPKPATKDKKQAKPKPQDPAKHEDKANKIVTTVFAVIMAILAILLIFMLVLPSDDKKPAANAAVDADEPELVDTALPDTPDSDSPLVGDDDGDDHSTAMPLPDDDDVAIAPDPDDGPDDDPDDDDVVAAPDEAPVIAPEPERLNYYWVRSDPAGATVHVNGEERGITPLMIIGLKRGAHDLKLTKEGYKDLLRVFHVPFRNEFFDYSMDLKPGHCLITSEPSGMAIMDGSLVVAHTPYLLKADPGQYHYRMVGAGYALKPFIAMVSEDRPTKVNLKMRLVAGSLKVVTLPAGATVYVDGMAVGQTEDQDRGDSNPTRITGIRPGIHKISIAANGKRSPEQTVTIRAGELDHVGLMIYDADTVITTRDNKKRRGMFRKKSPNGDVLLAIRPDKSIVIKSTDIQQIEFLQPEQPEQPDPQP